MAHQIGLLSFHYINRDFFLRRKALWDALRMRFGIPLKRIPQNCECGSPFNVQHALSCPKGGFTIILHNEVRDLTAKLLAEVCTNTTVEPTLAPLTGEKRDYLSSIKADDARADVSARGLWQKGQTAYCGVGGFNPLTRCYLNRSLIAVHHANENEKKRKYNQRIINIDLQGPFTPLVFSCFGGTNRELTDFIVELQKE